MEAIIVGVLLLLPVLHVVKPFCYHYYIAVNKKSKNNSDSVIFIFFYYNHTERCTSCMQIKV